MKCRAKIGILNNRVISGDQITPLKPTSWGDTIARMTNYLGVENNPSKVGLIQSTARDLVIVIRPTFTVCPHARKAVLVSGYFRHPWVVGQRVQWDSHMVIPTGGTDDALIQCRSIETVTGLQDERWTTLSPDVLPTGALTTLFLLPWVYIAK